MILTKLQIRLFIFLLSHYLDCEGHRIGMINEIESAVIYGLNYLWRLTNEESVKTELAAEADSEERWLDSILDNWRYRRFYLRGLKVHLANLYRRGNANDL